MLPRILWIEEETLGTLSPRRSHLETSLQYDLCIVDNAREAEEFILSREFDALILDLRIYSGYDDKWVERKEKDERVGLWIIGIIAEKRPEWRSRLGVYTNETYENIQTEFVKYQIDPRNFLHKPATGSNHNFKRFVDRLIHNGKQ